MKLLLRAWFLEAFKMIKENSAHSQIETIIIDASDREKVIEAINAEIDDVIKAIKPRVI
jgi:saccharopine dehydrogenase-like NADP-dependent oxidoreductase